VPLPGRSLWTRSADRQTRPDAVAPGLDEVCPPAAVTGVDVAYSLTRSEAESLVRAVAPRGGVAHAWPASPDGLRAAVEHALGQEVAPSSVNVMRLPGALHSPEAWQVRLVSVSPAGRERVDESIRAARSAGPIGSGGSRHVR
jgi:hypothetical protein